MAPTFQTARAMIDGGEIGDAVSVTMAGLYEPPEVWHPDPRFLYAPGGGPLFDMGPYFLHVLFDLLGSVVEVCAITATDPHPRTIGAGPLAGQAFQAGTPTSVAAVLQLASGAIATLHMSFDVRASTLPFIEVHGSRGTLVLPDPEQLEGQLRYCANGTDGWRDVPTAPPTARHARGAGLADLARRLRGSPAQRLPRDFGIHAVEVMEGILSAGVQRCSVRMVTSLAT
jgi:predicted dehydrogenase